MKRREIIVMKCKERKEYQRKVEIIIYTRRRTADETGLVSVTGIVSSQYSALVLPNAEQICGVLSDFNSTNTHLTKVHNQNAG